MAKKRKTREQKHHADSRHNFTHELVLNTFEAKLPSAKISTQYTPAHTTSYTYLVKDLTRTFTLTLGIIIAQVILFLFLKNHLIRIPGLPY